MYFGWNRRLLNIKPESLSFRNVNLICIKQSTISMPICASFCKFHTVWKFSTSEDFHCLSVEDICSQKSSTIIAGHENGEIGFYSIPDEKDKLSTKKSTCHQPVYTLESKGGPVQCMVVADVTRLQTKDVVVADSKGIVTIFHNKQILRRKAVSDDVIHCIVVQKDALGNVIIVTGDRSGQLCAFNPYTDFWRLRLSDVSSIKDQSELGRVQCVLSVDLSNVHGQICTYVLACDSSRHLFVLSGGTVVKVITTPSVIQALCSGKFVMPEELESGDSQTGALVHDTQVAMGSDTGAIYIMSNFELYSEEYANIGVGIKQMVCLKAADIQSTDTILCSGAFNGLSVVRENKECARYKTSSWVETVCLADTDHDGVPEIILGCQDKTVQALKVTFS